MGLYYFILGHYYLDIPESIQIWEKNPYFLNIFNFGQFWPAEINKKAGRPAGWSTGRPVEISNPDTIVQEIEYTLSWTSEGYAHQVRSKTIHNKHSL